MTYVRLSRESADRRARMAGWATGIALRRAGSEVQIKNHAFRRASQFVVPPAMITWLGSLQILQMQPGAQGWTNVFLMLFGVALLAATWSTAIVAWHELDPSDPVPVTT